MFEEFTKAQQDELTRNWQNPVAHTVVATILYRLNPSLMDWEFLITRRLKGAAKGHLQVHHGGFTQVTDKDQVAAAIREVREETGYCLKRHELAFFSLMGPEHYRSTMSFWEGYLKLTILDVPAEPTAPFVITLFSADVTGKEKESIPDGEVEEVGWPTLKQVIEQYGQSPTFNYFSFLFWFLKQSLGQGQTFPPSSPGEYFTF
jgi:8-oxo-dGTP pyrophosphatase MutT (NUDIX family)